tara:strand:+ start:102 stop:596 length:495 start_codon:yes stop_codon:yes gene_type:complete
MVKVYSQILEDSYMKQLHDTMLGEDFPWFFYPDTAVQGDGRFMFTHIFFIRNTINSSFYFLLEPILKFIKEKKNYEEIYRIKANLYTIKNKPLNQPSHYDYIKDDKNCFIALFNLDTCNGGTVIENKKIKSKKNELIIFDNVEHYGITQSDTTTRVVINFLLRF